MARVDRGNAQALVTVDHVELRRLARPVPQPLEDRGGGRSERERICGGSAEADERQTGDERSVGGASQQPVRLEPDRQAVGRRAADAGAFGEVGRTHRTGRDGVEDANRLVEHADPAYSVHWLGTVSHMLRSSSPAENP